MNSVASQVADVPAPDGFVAVIELPGGRMVVLPMRANAAEAREVAFALVSTGITVLRCAVVPVVSTIDQLTAAATAA